MKKQIDIDVDRFNWFIFNMLGRVRKARELSQEDAATQSELTQAYLSQVENGKRTPTTAVLIKLCSVYNISFGDLVKSAEEFAKKQK